MYGESGELTIRKCGALPVGYSFVALVVLIILFKNPK